MRLLRFVFSVLIFAYIVYDFTNDADRDESGSIVGGGQIDVFTMREGDCFNDPQEIIDDSTVEVDVQDVAGLPCSEPHDNEVYAVFDVSLSTFPGDGSMFDVATDECLKRFRGFVGISYKESILDIFAIYPTSEYRSRMNDR